MYMETWTKFRFPMLISNTLLYTACTVCVIALLAPMAAYKLARTKQIVRGVLCTYYHANDGALPVLHDHFDQAGGKSWHDRE